MDCGEKDYVLYFGRYSSEKGVRTLIDAAKKLPDINFVCAGRGEYAEQMKDVPNIKDVGFQTGDDLVRLITEAEFSVCPSEWYENCPLSVMESQKYGTSVIGARIGGIPELVIDGENGLLFESGNADDLAEKIRELWADEDRLQRFTRQCQEMEYDTAEEYVEKCCVELTTTVVEALQCRDKLCTAPGNRWLKQRRKISVLHKNK